MVGRVRMVVHRWWVLRWSGNKKTPRGVIHGALGSGSRASTRGCADVRDPWGERTNRRSNTRRERSSWENDTWRWARREGDERLAPPPDNHLDHRLLDILRQARSVRDVEFPIGPEVVIERIEKLVRLLGIAQEPSGRADGAVVLESEVHFRGGVHASDRLRR